MSQPTNAVKQRWNETNYTQVKVSVKPAVAAAFKAACSERDQSMASVISEYMTKYAVSPKMKRSAKKTSANTLQGRREMMRSVIDELTEILGGESDYIENMPENLRCSEKYEDAVSRYEALETTLELAAEIYA